MLAGDRVLLRVDAGGLRDVSVDRPVLDAIAGAGAVLVSDYGRGLTADPAVREALTAAAARVPLVWDPHPNGAPPVPGATLVTPNLAEARGYVSEMRGYSDENPTHMGFRTSPPRWARRCASTGASTPSPSPRAAGAPCCAGPPAPR